MSLPTPSTQVPGMWCVGTTDARGRSWRLRWHATPATPSPPALPDVATTPDGHVVLNVAGQLARVASWDVQAPGAAADLVVTLSDPITCLNNNAGNARSGAATCCAVPVHQVGDAVTMVAGAVTVTVPCANDGADNRCVDGLRRRNTPLAWVRARVVELGEEETQGEAADTKAVGTRLAADATTEVDIVTSHAGQGARTRLTVGHDKVGDGVRRVWLLFVVDVVVVVVVGLDIAVPVLSHMPVCVARRWCVIRSYWVTLSTL